MTPEKMDIHEEQKNLVLARLKILNPDTKIMLGTQEKISVMELIDHVEKGDAFGEKIIKAQMNMLKILGSV